MTVVVRAARPEDASALSRLADALNDHVGFAADRLSAEAVRRDGFGTDPAFLAVVAEDAGEIVGFALCHPAYETGWSARGAFLSDLFITPQARGKGIARRLIAEVARISRDNGIRYMWWVVDEDNESARALYQSLGARETPTIECLLDPEKFAALAESSDD